MEQVGVANKEYIHKDLFDKYYELLSEQTNTAKYDLNIEHEIKNLKKELEFEVNFGTVNNIIKEDFDEVKKDYIDKIDEDLVNKNISIYKTEIFKIAAIEEQYQNDEVDGKPQTRKFLLKVLKFAINELRKYLNTIIYLSGGKNE